MEESDLEFYSLVVTDEAHPNNFTMEFSDTPDADKIWRVEFVSGMPALTGFDH